MQYIATLRKHALQVQRVKRKYMQKALSLVYDNLDVYDGDVTGHMTTMTEVGR